MGLKKEWVILLVVLVLVAVISTFTTFSLTGAAVGSVGVSGNPSEGINAALNLFNNTEPLINASTKISGNSTFNGTGQLIKVADVNNDGIDDILIVAEKGGGVVGNKDGRVYVFFGKQSGLPIQLNLSQANMTFEQFDSGTLASIKSIASGYINNDNLTDLVFGNDQKVFLWYGSSTLPKVVYLNSTNLNWTYEQSCGNAVSQVIYCDVAVGEFNGDNLDDIVIVNGDSFGNNTIFYGGSLNGDVNDSDANVTIANWIKNYQGVDRIYVDDINGDGKDDLIFSDKIKNFAGGYVHVIYGNHSFPSLLNLSNSDVLINGSYDIGGRLFGEKIITGDLNGDNFFDIIVTEPESQYTAFDDPPKVGRVHIFFGSDNMLQFLSVDQFNTDANVTISGTSSGARFGTAIAVGDYNKDGITDLLIGSRNETGPENSGEAYLFFGGPNLIGTFNTSQANVTFKGTNAFDRAGTSVAMGDLNNNQYDDVIIGATHADPFGVAQAGEVYIIDAKVNCGIITFDTTLNQDLNVTGTCFSFNTSNVTLDGGNHQIRGNNTGYGVNISGSADIGIKYLRISGFDIGIYINTTGKYHRIESVKINESNSNAINIVNDGGVNVTFINVSLDKSNISVGTSSSMFFMQFVNVFVNDTAGNILSNVNVTATNSTGSIETFNLTGSDGFARMEVIEFFQEASVRAYRTNHTFNVSKNNFLAPVGQNINLSVTNSTSLTFSMTATCGNITSNLTLGKNIIRTTSGCFNIQANNLVIDGSGSTIIGSGTGAGINITGFANTTIINFNFDNFSIGIQMGSANDTIVTNVSISNSTTFAVVVSSGTGNTFTNVSFNRENVYVAAGADFSVGWYLVTTVRTGYWLLNGSNVTVYNVSGQKVYDNINDITAQNKFSLTEFHQVGSTRVYDTPHNITAKKGKPLSSDVIFTQRGNIINLTLTNNTKTNFTLMAELSCGVSLNENTVFATTNITGCARVGVSITSTERNNNNLILDLNNSIITGNKTNNDPNFVNNGLELSGVKNVTVKNLKIINFSIGIYFTAASGNTAANITVINATDGILNDELGNVFLGYHAHNNTVLDSILINNTRDVNITDKAKNIILLNVTFDKNSIFSTPNTELFNKWWATFLVNATNGTTLENVNLTAVDVNGLRESYAITGDDGRVRVAVTEFLKDEFGYTYYTPHTFTLTLDGYYQNKTVIDISATNNSQLAVTLTRFSCGQAITGNITLGGNLSASGTCITDVADNSIINGNGHTLLGSATGIGINLTGRRGVTISNLIITNYSDGIVLKNTNSTTFVGLIINNNTRGILINNSHDNIFRDSTINGNTGDAVFVVNDGGTNNTFINTSVNISAINVTGTATIYYGWYVTVNVTYNNNLSLQGANVTAYFESDDSVDTSILSGVNGIAKLEAIELKKNATGIFYLTPHNITTFFNSSSDYSQASNSINLTVTQNTYLNHSLSLNCTSPPLNTGSNAVYTICPGSFDGEIKIDGSNITVQCDTTVMSTILTISGGVPFSKNISVKGCTFSGLLINGPTNIDITINNTNFSGGISINPTTVVNNLILSNFHINVTSVATAAFSSLGSLQNSTIGPGTMSSSHGFSIGSNGAESNNIIRNIKMTVTGNSPVIYITNGTNNTIHSNSFFGGSSHVLLGTDTSNTTVYNNTFDSLDTSLINTEFAVDLGTGNQFNSTLAGIAVGNSWGDFCGLDLVDTDADGYADSGAAYPYNVSNGANVLGKVNDRAPKILSCPATTAEGAGGGSSKAAAAAVTGDETITKGKEAAAAIITTPEGIQIILGVTPSDIGSSSLNKLGVSNLIERKPLNIEEKISITIVNPTDREITITPKLAKIEYTIPNEETFDLLLQKIFSGTTRNIEEMNRLIETWKETAALLDKSSVKFINIRKTANLYSIKEVSSASNIVDGKLLRPEITTKEIVVGAGETLSSDLVFKRSISIDAEPISVSFEIDGEIVGEHQIVKQEALRIGTAININAKELEIYVLFPKGEKAYYELELSIDGYEQENDTLFKTFFSLFSRGKVTKYGELYGPYFVSAGQTIVLAEKFNMPKKIGLHTIVTKIMRDGDLVSENVFHISDDGTITIDQNEYKP